MEINPKSESLALVLKIVIWVAVLCVTTGTVLLLVLLNNNMSKQKALGVEIPKHSSFQQTARVMASDSIRKPPARSEVFSAARNYIFVVSTPDNWKSRKAVGELFQVTDSTRKLLWKMPLPHEYGSRYVLVGDRGQVLLLDSWINVKSPYAIMVLNREKNLVAAYDFDAVQKLLNVPVARVVEMAKHGWWIASSPKLDNSGDRAIVDAGGKVLTIRLDDGHLAVSNN